MKKHINVILQSFLVILLIITSLNFIGCASAGPTTGTGTKIFKITLNISEDGEIDTLGNGYYAILFNNMGESIEVTNYDTFTDFIRFDGANFSWFHRQANVPSPGYTWVTPGNLNALSSIGNNGKSLIIRIDLNDSECIFNKFITTQKFTVHVVTTDKSNSLLGRALDTLGQGPSIGGNTLYTVFFDKNTGVSSPPPPNFPWDPLGDWSPKSDLGTYPYNNFDIASFNLEFE